jgi:threonine dehydratase
MNQPPLSLKTILEATHYIHRQLSPTPLIPSPYLSEISRAEVWLKLENCQPTGSFKVRGALNKITSLSMEERRRGVVTASAGNHGLGVAFSAGVHGLEQATVFVPGTAPKAKLEKLRRFPIDLRRAGESYEAAHQAAVAFAAETGAVFLEAYDDVTVIAGQASCGVEIFSQLPAVDAILTPVGGGGLIAGIATYAKTINPLCQMIGVQPAASPAALLSLRDGTSYDPYDNEPTLADGLAGGFGKLPFYLARLLIDGILLADEEELRRAIFTLVDKQQLIVEASGAIAITPLLFHKQDFAGRKVVCVLTGANIDSDILKQILDDYCA